jgi:hypothetical protein
VLEQGGGIYFETLETGQVTEAVDKLKNFFQVARFVRRQIDLDLVRLSIFGISTNAETDIVLAVGIALLGLEDISNLNSN